MNILVIHRLSVGGFKKGLAEKRGGSYSYLQVSMLLCMVESSRGNILQYYIMVLTQNKHIEG